MIRHVVLFRFTEAADPAAVEAALDGLSELPDRIPALRSYEVRRDAGVTDGAFDACIIAGFDDVEGFIAYRDHPLHVEHAKERLGPLVAERAAIQIRD